MKTNKLRFIVLLLMLSMVAVACGGGTTEEAEETPVANDTPEETFSPVTTAPPPEVIVVWAEEKVAVALEPLVGEYEAAAGVDVEIVVYDFGAIRTDVQTAGPAGEGPDVFLGAHDWVGELAANGVIAPVNISAIADDLFDVGIAGFSYGGMTYGVPYATEAIAMYYNADYVDSVPATWDEVKAACDAVDAAEICVGAPGGGGGGDAYHNIPFVQSAGGYIFKFNAGFDPSDVGLDNEGALASAEYLDGLVKDGVVASTDYGASMSAFQEGRSVFWMTGPWARNDASAVNYGVGLIPAFGDSPATPFVGVRGAMVSSFSEKKLLAESFILDFFVTVEVQEAMYNSDPRLPATKSLFAIVEAADPIAAQFAASAANGIPMPNIPEMGSVWGPVGDALLIIRDQNYGTNEETGVTVNTASDAMKLAAEQVRTAIAGG